MEMQASTHPLCKSDNSDQDGNINHQESPALGHREIESQITTIPTDKCYHVNTISLPAKLAYIFEAARRLSYTPNLVLFLTGIGLTKQESGYIMGFRLIGMLIAGPFWGMICDKWKCHRIVIVIMCLTSITAMCAQPLITMKYGDPVTNKCPYIENHLTANCTSSAISNCSQNTTNFPPKFPPSVETSEQRNNNTLFYVMLFMYIAVSFCEGSAVAFVDTATIRRIQLNKTRHIDFGKQKMWSSLGASFGNVSANLIIEHFPASNVTCYSGMFITYALYTIMLTVSLLYLYKGISFETDANHDNDDEPQKKEALHKTLYNAISQFDIVFLYLTAFVCGVVYAPYVNFFFLYLKQELEGSPTLFNLCVPVASVGVLAGYFFSVRIIQLLGGTWNAMVLSFIAYVVRFCGMGLIENPWLVLLFQPLHSLTYSLFLTAGLTHLKETSPISVITSTVSIFVCLHYGVGPMLGTVISGVVYTKFGGRILYLATSVLALFWCFLILLYVFMKKSNDAKRQKQSIDEKAKEEALLKH